MSVYLTPPARTTRTRRWPYVTHCYMAADTTEELHDAAELLHLRAEWVQQEHEPHEHFDLTRSAYLRALDHPGIHTRVVTKKELVAIMRGKRGR